MRLKILKGYKVLGVGRGLADDIVFWRDRENGGNFDINKWNKYNLAWPIPRGYRLMRVGEIIFAYENNK